MRLKGILITVVTLLALVFALFNWGALTTALPINFLLFSVAMPLGLILLLNLLAVSFAFFFVSLLDRAGQLRQITHLEHQLEDLSEQLEKKRLKELESVEGNLKTRIDALEKRLIATSEGVQARVLERIQAEEEALRKHSDKLEERVLLVRNELAADLGMVETALREERRSATPELPSPEPEPDNVGSA